MSTYTYMKFTAKGTRKGVCDVCGKRTTRSLTFSQTVSPFNKNEDGTVKTEAQVIHSVWLEAEEWAKGQVRHAGCEEKI